LVASRSTRAGFKSVALVGGTVLVFVALVAVGPTLASLPGGAWINLQVTSYGDRVLSGLSAEAQAADSSIQYRDIEDVYLLEAVRTSPVVGHGFGYAYKPPSGQSDFLLNYAPYYAHNFYLWLLAKTGVLGGVLFAFVVIPPLLRVLRSASNAALAAAAGLASMLAVSFVAPIPLGGASSILFGALVGFVTVKSKSYAEYGTLNAHRPDVPRTGNQLTVS